MKTNRITRFLIDWISTLLGLCYRCLNDPRMSRSRFCYFCWIRDIADQAMGRKKKG